MTVENGLERWPRADHLISGACFSPLKSGCDVVYCVELPSAWLEEHGSLASGWCSRMINPFLFSVLLLREELKHQIGEKKRADPG